VNVVETRLRRIDGFQQRHRPTAFAFGVIKKYGDDNAGSLAVQLTYAMFMTLFPLLLIVVTVTGIVLADDPSARARVAASAFGQFPIVGTQLAHNVHALRRSSVFGLIVGLVGLVYGATGLAQSGLYAMAQIWTIPLAERPSFVTRLERSLLFLALMGVGLIVTTGLSMFGTFGRHNVVLGDIGELLALIVAMGLFLCGFRVLTPKQVPFRSLVPGAVIAAIGWTILEALGGYVVGHDLKGASATYGMFGLVIGLIAWIALVAAMTLYAAEVNVVHARQLWPRSLVQPPLTDADRRSIDAEVRLSQRRADQEVSTAIRGTPMTEDEYRERGYPSLESERGEDARAADSPSPTDVPEANAVANPGGER
jgi:YihY family inner membrane protein